MGDAWRPADVEQAYRTLLRSVATTGIPADVTLTSHWPLLGTASRRLLIVGQAVFGWIPNWRVTDLLTIAGTNRVIGETQSACYERSDPMNWILQNRVRSSPFWRTARRLIELSFPTSAHPWYSHVAWTNIYPVARNDVVGNPVGELRTSQTLHAARLLDVTATTAQPEAVIVLGGSYWWDVAELLPLEDSVSVERPLLAAGSRAGMPWVAGWHPGGAQRRGWGADRYASYLVDAISGQRTRKRRPASSRGG